MFLDVNSPLSGESIQSNAPEATYTKAYLNRTFAVVEAFKDYPNTAAFFAGNEVISQPKDGAADPPYIRAVIRDLKSYIAKHASRAIPVGYAAADVRPVLADTFEYLQCSITGDNNTDDGSRPDFFAVNSYSWCGDSSFTISSYNVLVDMFANSTIPIFFSEYGCNTVRPRVFTEVPVLYGDQMDGVFSGGIVYEFTNGSNAYGLVNYQLDGSASLSGDFYTLKNQFASLNFTSIQGISPPDESLFVPACSADLIQNPIFQSPDFSTEWNLPSSAAQDLIDAGVSPAPSGKIVTISKLIRDSLPPPQHTKSS